MLKKQTFLSLTGVIFILVGSLHLLRILFSWPLILGQWSAPMWPSFVAVPVAYILGFTALRMRSKLFI